MAELLGEPAGDADGIDCAVVVDAALCSVDEASAVAVEPMEWELPKLRAAATGFLPAIAIVGVDAASSKGIHGVNGPGGGAYFGEPGEAKEVEGGGEVVEVDEIKLFVKSASFAEWGTPHRVELIDAESVNDFFGDFFWRVAMASVFVHEIGIAGFARDVHFYLVASSNESAGELEGNFSSAAFDVTG